MLVVAAGAHKRGDKLALEENLDGKQRQRRVDLGAGEAMGHAVIMGGDLDVIIDATRHLRHSENSYGWAGRDLSDGRSTVYSNCGALRGADG